MQHQQEQRAMQSRTFVVAAICVACFSGAARGQTSADTIAVGCYQRAIEAVRARRPQTVTVRLAMTPLRREAKDAETRLVSEGVYAEQRDGPWHRFTYDCRYTDGAPRAQVTVTFEGNDALRNASPR